MKEDEIDRILSDLVTGENISQEDSQLLQEWKKRGEQGEWFENEIRRLKDSREYLKFRGDKGIVFARVERLVRKQQGRRLLIRWSAVAASVAILLGSVVYFMFLSGNRNPHDSLLANNTPGTPKAELVLPEGKVIQLDTFAREIIVSGDQMKVSSAKNTLIYDAGGNMEKIEYHTIRVPRGAEYNLQLSDNTRVFLNAGSSLRYPVRFEGDVREVFLTGEGYFEVTRDTTRPFVVKAGEIGVRVLGTSFNVNAYPDEKMIEATLVEGMVQVDDGIKKQVLTPGMQLAYNRETGESGIREVDVEVYTSWKDGYYYFKRESLEKIVDVLARWYNLNVFFQNDELKSIEFGGRLKRYEDITYLLEKMEETQDVEFIINDNTIIIKRKTD